MTVYPLGRLLTPHSPPSWRRWPPSRGHWTPASGVSCSSAPRRRHEVMGLENYTPIIHLITRLGCLLNSDWSVTAFIVFYFSITGRWYLDAISYRRIKQTDSFFCGSNKTKVKSLKSLFVVLFCVKLLISSVRSRVKARLCTPSRSLATN